MQLIKSGNIEERPRRILMLVPHEPDADPRVRWVMQLCGDIAPTEVIGLDGWSDTGIRKKPFREYEGNVWIERIERLDYASWKVKFELQWTKWLSKGGAITRYLDRERNGGATLDLGCLQRVDHAVGAWCRFRTAWAAYNLMIDALYVRARSSCIAPTTVVCHDVFALAAGVKLKQLFRCRLLYDAHEFWPEADLLAQPWEKEVMAAYEGALVQHADAVVTVTPQIARHLEQRYRIKKVVCAPNAAPTVSASFHDKVDGTKPEGPIKVLFQGQVAWRRGMDELLRAWRNVDASLAVLYVRCPENDYSARLQNEYKDLIAKGQVLFLDAVAENELVAAAKMADIGIIPYVGPNLNHLYCCPNKLSQYMQAGLAILANRLEFIAQIVERFQCGMLYDAHHPESLVKAVRYLADHRSELQIMRRRARLGAQTEFNWESQSVEYRRAVEALCMQT